VSYLEPDFKQGFLSLIKSDITCDKNSASSWCVAIFVDDESVNVGGKEGVAAGALTIDGPSNTGLRTRTSSTLVLDQVFPEELEIK
jgi:hypothetical protein